MDFIGIDFLDGTSKNQRAIINFKRFDEFF